MRDRLAVQSIELLRAYFSNLCLLVASLSEMTAKTPKHAIRLINKCLWKTGAEDLYRCSFKESRRSQAALSTSTVCKQANDLYYNERSTIGR